MITTSNSNQLNLTLCVPALRLADPMANADHIRTVLQTGKADPKRPTLCLFPELCLTGKTCGDLFFQPLLLDAAEKALLTLDKTCCDLGLFAVVGLPLRLDGQVFNAAALLSPQGLLRFVLQSNPASQGLERWFQSGTDYQKLLTLWQDRQVPVSTDGSFREPALSEKLIQIIVGDSQAAQVSNHAALVLNPDAQFSIAPAETEIPWAVRHSKTFPAIAASCSAGPWESSTDAVYSGLGLVCQGGEVLSQTNSLSFQTESASVLIDLAGIVIPVSDNILEPAYAISAINSLPFINSKDPEVQFKTILDTQATALARRLLQTGQNKVVLGISGGSDSSLALLVCVYAFDLLAFPRKGITAVSLPGPGSSSDSKARTYNLVDVAGVTARTISIASALEGHLNDIGHEIDLFDTTYENAQARERTQILMDLANQENALMVGTGDMSEIALGWCTFNGDHMSFYDPNAGLPKTLLLRVLAWAGAFLLGEEGGKAATAVSEATISPELVPAKDGINQQATEDILGPYLAHDFFLYYGLYRRHTPRQLFGEAQKAFSGLYAPTQLLTWMRTFFKRLFSQQFKRSASADGPQLVEFSLSPRGGFVLPSDASASLWLQEIDVLQKELEA